MPSPLHSAALAYARKGWHVFPLTPGSKEPLKGTRGHLDASNNPAQIDAWWNANGDYNIGVAVTPSGIVVLDVDVAEGKPGRKSLEAIDAQLPDTLTAITGRGGLHAVFERPTDMQVGRRIGFRPGLDLLGDGYIVVAPSVLAAGGQYRWNRDVVPAPLPPVLREAAVAPKATVEKVQLIGTPIGEGGRNVALFRLGAALRDQGIGAEALARALDAENHQRCNPPLPDSEIALIVNSVLQRVQPSRDVAAGAVVEQEIAQIFAPTEKAVWVSDVAQRPAAPIRFYPTGFVELDDKIGGGVATGQIFGVIGPPSSGKSGFVGELIINLQKQVPVLHVSDELTKRELTARYAANKLEFPWIDGIKGRVKQNIIAEACAGLRVKLLDCDDLDRNDPIGHIRAEAMKLRDLMGVPPIIVLDYVQLLARGAEEQARHKVGELTMRLRMLSQELDTAIIAVFSTSRAFYGGAKLDAIRKGDDPTAYLAAAKESGDIEYDCATLVYLDIDKLREGQPKPGRIAIARCRVGEVGFVGVRARLDVGKWWADPSALSEMTVEERDGNRAAQQLEKDCERLLSVVRKMPGRAWRELKTACGMDFKRCDAARSKLVELGVCEFVKESYFDTLHREQKRDILRERNAAAPSDVPADKSV